MIKGTGIDIIEIQRIKEAMEKNPRFLLRIFTPDENKLFHQAKYRPNMVAGFFAAKEAFAKALGTGIREFKWRDIEVSKDPAGRPFIKLHNNAKNIAYSKDIRDIHLSISHSKEYAIAQVIVL